MAIKLLMCPPTYYDRTVGIDPWSNVRKRINLKVARAQWDLLYKILTERIGADVDLLQPVKGLPDMVFAAHGGIVEKNIFVKSNFRQRERQPEAAFFETWFQDRGYEVVSLPKGYSFEGEGDAFVVGDTIYHGYHDEQDLQIHDRIGGILKKQVVSLKLIDSRFHHLDCCFSGVNTETVMVYRNAFATSVGDDLTQSLKNCIMVDCNEASRLMCNSLAIGNKMIIPTDCPQTANMLKAVFGFRVFPVDLSEFTKGGGGIKSLVLWINRY